MTDSFPLAAFLSSLETRGFRLAIRDHSRVITALGMGGRWDMERLRFTLAALLAKDVDQKEMFNRAFDAFFDSSPATADTVAIDVARVREDLARLTPGKPPIPVPDPVPPIRYTPPVSKPPNRYPLLICLLAILAASFVFRDFLIFPAFRISEKIPTPITEPEGELILKTELRPDERERIYPARPVIDSPEFTRVARRDRWKWYAGISAVIFVLAVCYSIYLWKYRKPPEDEAPEWHAEKEHWFDVGAIGGKPSPRLDRETLEQLADSAGYFKTSEFGKKPDLRASVRATVAKGIPELVWSRRVANRSLILLEDRFAESLEWNPAAGELRHGLERLGVPVLYGRFNGAPDSFFTEDNRTVHLEDLEAGRRGYLLLIFSDGRGIRGEQDRYALESVARWPMKAWMEPRTEKFWDESTVRVARHGIPVFPATPGGLSCAFRRFLSESASPGRETATVSEIHGPPARGKLPLSAHMENLLGDTQPLARAAAMIQPVGFGMIDALRIRFFPHIRPEHVERLVALPNTQRAVYGLRFSDPVLRELRTGFAARTAPEKQERIIRFILEHVDREEPEDDKSPAHMNWVRVRERVRMEIEPDDALKRLAKLEKLPQLKSAVRADLGKIIAEKPDSDGETGGIPLLRMPKTRAGLQRLATLAKQSGIPRLEVFPIHPLKWTLLGIVWFLALFTGTTAVYEYLVSGNIMGTVKIASNQRLDGNLLVIKNDKLIAQVPIPIPTESPVQLPPGGDSYQLRVSGEGGRHTEKLGDGTMNADIRVNLTAPERPCLQEPENEGILIRRCPPGPKLEDDKNPYQYRSWIQAVGKAAPPGRTMSIGLETVTQDINESPVSNLGRMLLETRSIDVLYTVSGTVDSDRMMRIVNLITSGTDNMTTQLVVWENDGAAAVKMDILSDWFWGTKPVLVDGQALLDLLLKGETPVITGDEIRSVAKEKTGANKIVLLRNRWREPVTGMDFVWIPGGRFRMGTPETEKGRYDNEGPVHMVDLDGFWMGKYEVTNAQYREFKPKHESEEYKGHDFNGDRQPAVNVSWENTKDYLKWMGKNHNGTYTFRLPSEAEWEYACRAEEITSRYWGDDPKDACAYANVHDRTSDKAFQFSWEHHDCDDGYAVSAPVGRFKPNRFGLHDMLGNVWEWCGDWYDSDFYGNPGANERNPFNSQKGEFRVARGGGWDFPPYLVRCGVRVRDQPGLWDDYLGFRVVCVFPPSM